MIIFDCDSKYFYEIEGLVYFDDIFLGWRTSDKDL